MSGISFAFIPIKLSIENEFITTLDRDMYIKSLSLTSDLVNKTERDEFRLVNIRNNYVARFFFHAMSDKEKEKYEKIKNLSYYAEYGFAFNDQTYISFKSVSNVILYPEKLLFEVNSTLLTGDRLISYNGMGQDNTNSQWLWEYIAKNFEKLYRVDIEFFAL